MWSYLCSLWTRNTWAVMSWVWHPAMAGLELPPPDRPGSDDQFAEWLEELHHDD